MNQLLLYDLLQAVALLKSGRAHEGLAALVEAIREHGGVPVPQPGQPEPTSPKVPLWMRSGA